MLSLQTPILTYLILGLGHVGHSQRLSAHGTTQHLPWELLGLRIVLVTKGQRLALGDLHSAHCVCQQLLWYLKLQEAL